MVFNSFEFLWLFPVVFTVYYFFLFRTQWTQRIPRLCNYVLIAISYGLYIKYNPVYALVLLWVTLVTYYFALRIEKCLVKGNKRHLIWAGLILSLLPLLLFKYYDFVSSQLEACLSFFGICVGLPGLNWVMPLGISFFTLQAVGYLADVYSQRIKAEHNWWDYMLFVCFFPQIVSGPISKAKDLLPQIKTQRTFKYPQVLQGMKWFLWGMFIKVVVADTLGLRIGVVLDNYQNNSGIMCLLCVFFYSFQIYCDFAGYSFMAVGVGEVLGFELINNFRRPYFSQTVTEFWHRWHISLSAWLKDYIYIPLGGNRCSKARNYLNIFVTFMVSGIWHGASWTFIVWGALHGLFQIVEKILGINKLQSIELPLKWVRIIVTFVLVSFAWIFFRMPTLSDAWCVIVKIFTDGSGNVAGIVGPMSFILIVLFKDFMDEYQIKALRLLHSRYAIIRWATYLILFTAIATTGVYGGQFIYSGF